MFGNKFAANELAKNFQQEISKLQQIKKTATQKQDENSASEQTKVAREVSPEEFLVEPKEKLDLPSTELEQKIEEVESFVKDNESSCEKCDCKPCKCEPKTNCAMCGRDHVKENECGEVGMAVIPLADDMNYTDDMSYLMDLEASYVLKELGKVAGDLRNKNKNFAADMVEVTAMEIQKEALQKAAQKYQVVCGLKKMAKESYKKGDRITGDVISVTIENIKKSK